MLNGLHTLTVVHGFIPQNCISMNNMVLIYGFYLQYFLLLASSPFTLLYTMCLFSAYVANEQLNVLKKTN